MIHERHEMVLAGILAKANNSQKHEKNGLAKGTTKNFWPAFLTAAIDSIVS
jgi:hypothetical protein